MPLPTFSNITTRGGLISADFIDTLRQDSPRNPLIEYKNFPTFTKPAPENSRAFDEQMHKTFENLVEKYDAISNFYEKYTISDARQKWMIPLMKSLGFDPEYVNRDLTPGGDDRLVFRLSHQGWDSASAMYIHTVLPNQDLEKRPPEERRKWSSHEEMQRYLNRTQAHNWGIVTNGIALRIQREFFHTTTKAYVEFDIDNIMRERNFRDFRVLYRLCHVSRFLPHENEKYIIEVFYDQSVAAGVRVYENLQGNVKDAIEVLGNGFLDEDLLNRLIDDDEACRTFYQEIHRVIYRIMFLLYAEQRAMLPTRASLFIDEYSITKLREIAERRREPDDHTDLGEGLNVTFRLLQKGCEPLRVFPYNGSLFDPTTTPLISNAKIHNDRLLDAIRYLTLVEDERMSKRINYLDIGVEEMGSIYESLLDYKPKIFSSEQDVPIIGSRRNEIRRVPARTFFLDPRGTDRRSSGSYYTASNLVDELITHSLKPVAETKIEAATTKEAKEAALLSLKVCDPACGSGAFLIAAMNYLGKFLAQIRTDQSEPRDEDIREARREVLQHCIYGVDKNPMAVELAKVSLWIDAAVEDVPLNFLDHHIKCGDSLVGATSELLRAGIPDEAFKKTGDDNADIVKRYKQQNKSEHRQRTFDETITEVNSKCTEAYERLADLMEQNVADVYQKKALYDKIISSSDWKTQKFAADAWCATFFWNFTASSPTPPTQSVLRILQTDPQSEAVIKSTKYEITRLQKQYNFFHWWLEFPDVFGRAEKGFDVILGNPPFMGGLKISGEFGDNYRQFLSYFFNPFKGKSDLCATFFRRSFGLINNNGVFGLVATNTISQGDTRESGLLEITSKNGKIIFAHKFIEWPGEANVEVNLIAISKGDWKQKRILDFKEVLVISSHLDENLDNEAKKLTSNSKLAGVGSVIVGTGFILSDTEAKKVLNEDALYHKCLVKYLSGEDVNNNPFQEPQRWIINFFDWNLQEAKKYPKLFEIVQARVKPERDILKDDHYRLKWWNFGRTRMSFYSILNPYKKVIVRSRISENHMLVFVPNIFTYSEDVTIFAFDDFYHFSLLQSNMHEVWVIKRASTLGIGLRYTTTDCFENFPFPQSPPKSQIQTAEKIGTEYHEHRRQIMLNRQIGLTPTYNLFNNSLCTDTDVQILRDLHAAMDNAILACYGWQDIELKHNFYQNDRGQTRFTIAPEARIELLNRLLDLNLSIAEQEQNSKIEVDT